MNKPSIKSIRKQAQAGFTLIELIVVIVILGILAATALPKMASVGGDARLAALNAAKGALSTTTSMVHAQYLMTPGVATVTNEGVAISVNSAGYPTAATIAAGAGIVATDYAIFSNGNAPGAATTIGTVPVGTIVIVPLGISTTVKAVTCMLSYTDNAGSPPTITLTATTAGCQ